MLGFNLRHDTGYTEGFRGFRHSSYTLLDITINYASIASLQLLSNSLFAVLLAKTTNKHKKLLTLYKDPLARVNSFVSSKVYTENLLRFQSVNLNLTLYLPSHSFKSSTL